MVEVDEILEPLLILGVPQVLNGSLTTNGQLISTQLPIYTYGEQPNPWDVTFGTEILIHPNCLTGSGANTHGIKLRSDGINWKFADGGQTIYSLSGSKAAPLVSGVAGGTEVSLLGSLNQPMIPAYLLYEGCRGRVRAIIRKTGANGTHSVIVRLGTHAKATDINANDSLINFPSLAATDGREFYVDVEFSVVSAGRSTSGTPTIATGETAALLLSTNIIPPNATTVNGVVDRTNLFSTYDTIYFNFNVGSANALDTFSLIKYSVELLP